MVVITILRWGYKPTYNVWGPHIVVLLDLHASFLVDKINIFETLETTSRLLNHHHSPGLHTSNSLVLAFRKASKLLKLPSGWSHQVHLQKMPAVLLQRLP
jgi:hypothetical protein